MEIINIENEEIKYLKNVNEFNKLYYNRRSFDYLKIKYKDINEYNKTRMEFTFRNQCIGSNDDDGKLWYNNNNNGLIQHFIENPEITDDTRKYIIDQISNIGIIKYNESIKIFKLFKNQLYSTNESIKYFSAVYFIIYHQHKLAHYISNDDYSMFIIDLFFDNNIKLFNLLNYQSLFSSGKSLYQLINNILLDNRFDQFMTSHLNKPNLLRMKITTIFGIATQIDCWGKEFNFIGEMNENQQLFIQLLLEVYNQRAEFLNFDKNIVLKQPPFVFSSKPLIKKVKSSNNVGGSNEEIMDISNGDTITTDENFKFKLDNVLLSRILDLIMHNDNLDSGEIDPIITIKLDTSLALVNKSFFKVYSKLLNRVKFQWFSNYNISNEYCLIKEPPLYLNYESIRYFGWNDNIVDSFSRVSELLVDCDNKEFSINSNTCRNYIKKSEVDFNFNYNTLVLERDYLIYPPLIPSLKILSFKNYIGYNNISYAGFNGNGYQIINYNDLIDHILMNCGNGLISFNLQVIKSFESLPYFRELSFISTLLKYHHTTLKSITIEFYPQIQNQSLNGNIVPHDIISELEQYPNVQLEFIFFSQFFGNQIQYSQPPQYHLIHQSKQRITTPLFSNLPNVIFFK